jgi:AraC-like DNA-binding protein
MVISFAESYTITPCRQMEESCKNMDENRDVVASLVEWVSRHPRPPVIFAAYQRTISRNEPSPYMGFAYQDGAACEWWELGGRRHAFPAGHLVLLSTHRGSRSAEMRGGGGVWMCSFTLAGWEGREELFRRFRWDPRPVRSPARLLGAFRDVQFQLLAGHAARGLHLKSALLHLLGVAWEEMRPGSDARSAVPAGSTVKALQFLYAHYARSRISLDDVASAAGLSPDHFGRVFLRDMAASPMKYLQSLRMAQGRKLLEGTDLRVNEVAREVGFADSLHFSRMFHKATGTSPREYRARHREGGAG